MAVVDNDIVVAKVKSVHDQGFFAQLGPLEIFVVKQLIPASLHAAIRVGSDVRIQIINRSADIPMAVGKCVE